MLFFDMMKSSRKLKEAQMIKGMTLRSSFEKKAFVFGPESLPLLAVDYGRLYSGLALSSDGVCVFPVGVILTHELFSRMETLLQEKDIKQLVFGLPVSGDGKEGDLCQVIRQFAQSFESVVCVHFINERGSTQNIMSSSGKSKRDDDLAAAQILEFFLQSVRSVSKDSSL